MPTYTPFSGIAGVFSYDAVASSPRRTAPRTDLRTEDEILPSHDRDKLVSTSRDARRNYVVAGWMIRKHLDFVSDFQFAPNTPNERFNDQVAELMRKWAKRHTCHVAQMHPLRRLMRQQEACRTMDGDVLIELLRAGALNIIRGDRIRNPRGVTNGDKWIHGVNVGPGGRPLRYQIHNRSRWGMFSPDKQIPAANAILNGYFDDVEQIRGVSPMAAAINNLRDTYEGIDFALARLKVEQILGVAITRNPADGSNPFAGNKQFEPTEDDEDATPEETEAAEIAEARSPFANFGKGIWATQLDPGEDIKSIAGNMPGSNAIAFLDACIHLALKALDLPVSFWNEAHTNFFGSRAALQLYKRSAHSKQADNADLLEEITRWKVRQWMIDGRLRLPRGWILDDVEFPWTPRGIPWWDRSKEIVGDVRAIMAFLDNPEDICRDHGTGTPYEHIDKTRKVLEYAQQQLGEFGYAGGFTLGTGTPATDQPPRKSE